MTLHPDIGAEVQKFVLGKPVVLFQIDLTAFGDQNYLLSPHPFIADVSAPAPAAVQWRGQTWEPFPIEAEGFSESTKGPLPTPTLTVANVDLQFSALCLAFDDLRGAPVYRFRTFEQFLDGQPGADGDAMFRFETYRVERKVALNKLFVKWELAAAIDVEGQLLPRRQILQGACTRAYRVWDPDLGDFDYSMADCPYTGGSFFTDAGEMTADPVLDRCSKRVTSGCNKRFAGLPLPTWAFPGVARVTM